MNLEENIRRVRENIAQAAQEVGRDPGEITLVAATKTQSDETIRAAIAAGITVCGENRVQELVAHLENDAYGLAGLHFIGHLQTNKVRQLIGKTALIESVDSTRLLDLIDKESEKAGVVTRVLMQLHVAREETKFGFYPEELLDYFSNREFEKLKATHICGVMGMASNTDDMDRVRADFNIIAQTRRQILEIAPDLRGFDIVSMGMSGDWEIAVEEGSNLVRIGTAIFGSRQY